MAYLNCEDVIKLKNLENVECCEYCHEDKDHYNMDMIECYDTSHGFFGEICCIVDRALDKG